MMSTEFHQTSKSSSRMISIVYLFSAIFIWTSVDCWSYNYSENTMNWADARAWCQEHYTDMVAIQNQEEIAHLKSWLPRKPTYYWIGIRKIDNVWTWVGTNKALTEEAKNWAENEPNGAESSLGNEDCVEMYIKREYQEGKWNDERCGKLKTALCYTASCKNNSCIFGECVETINSHRCQCHEGFYGERCENVVFCNRDEVTVPDNGNVSCAHTYGDYAYDSECQYSCEEGYQLSAPGPLKCTADTTWSDQPPTCELMQCENLSDPEWGSVNCSHPLGLFSYRSTCAFACDEGYVLTGSQTDTLICEPTGQWNATQPSCTAVQCTALSEKSNLIMTCDDTENARFSFGKSCSFSCATGFNLVGPSTITCTSSAEWSGSMPFCEAVQCAALPNLQNGVTDCGDDPETKFSYENTCSFKCLSGYELVGATEVTCTSESEWSDSLPRCEAVHCHAIPEMDNTIVNCGGDANAKFTYGNSCSFSCSSGYRLNGTKTLTCTASAEWSGSLPHCQIMFCPVLEKKLNLIMNCSSDQSDLVPGSTCSFGCERGFVLQGAEQIKCSEEAQWDESTPICEAIVCPLLEAPQNGHINCSSLSEPRYDSQCTFSCDQDYTLDGLTTLTCGHSGNWTGDIPTCQSAPSQMTLIASGVAAGGAASLSGLSLALWILRKLKKRATKFDLSSSDIEVPPQVYKNSLSDMLL